MKKYVKLKTVHGDFLAVSGANAKKQYAKKFESELKAFAEVKADLISIYQGKKIDGPDKLNRQRDELISLRKLKNTQYQESKKKTGDIDYCRKVIDDYLKNERGVQGNKRTKSELE